MASILPIQETTHKGFVKMLLASEYKHYIANGSWQPKSFSASSFVDCGRKQLYGLLGYAKTDGEIVTEYKRSALVGDIIHQTLQSWAIASGFVDICPDKETGKSVPFIEQPLGKHNLAADKYQLLTRLKLGGRLDGVLKRSDGTRVVWELKSVAGKYLDNPTPFYARLFQKNLTHYESQTQLYMHLLDLKDALVLVINRETFLDWLTGRVNDADAIFQEYHVTYDPLFIEPELERIEVLNGYLMRAELSAPEPHRGECKFCDWRSACPLPSSEKR